MEMAYHIIDGTVGAEKAWTLTDKAKMWENLIF